MSSSHNIAQMGNNIVVMHKTMGRSTEAYELGPMSMELALYLDYKLKELELRDKGDLENLSGIQYLLTKDTYLRDIIIRSQLAGMRGYKPRIVEEFDLITPYGLMKARKAKIVVDEINKEFDNIVYAPGDWQNLDEMFITAGFPIRVLTMLKLLIKGIKVGYERYQQEQQSNKPSIQNPLEGILDEFIPIDPMQNLKIAAQKQQEAPTPQVDVLSDIRDARRQADIPQQRFDPFIIPNSIDISTDNRVWVATSTFTQKSRNDLNVLIKYGLVDLKTYNLGEIGRPKHIVRPSLTGNKLIKDLGDLRLI